MLSRAVKSQRMNRRTFAQSVGGAALAASQAQGAAGKTRYYRLEYLYMHQGDQGARVNEFLASQMPLIAKNARAAGVFTTVIGAHSPMTLVLTGHESMDEMEASHERLRANAEYRAAFEKLQAGSEPPYDTADVRLLRAADFSPEIVPPSEKPKTPRIFELRIYHSPTARQLEFLHQRFRSAEIPIFHRCGIFPILYGDTIAGANMPNQAYMIPFENLAAREKAWDAFGADPEWIKVRDASIAHGGQIVANIEFTFLRPAAFSPIQ